MFTVLIIDDEAQNCEILGRLFERSGWTAYCLTDSTHALLELGRVRPDVVILDMMMPKVDGMTILRGIRSDIALGDTPVIMYSALSDDRTRARALEAGADDYIVKTTPFAQIRDRATRIAA